MEEAKDTEGGGEAIATGEETEGEATATTEETERERREGTGAPEADRSRSWDRRRPRRRREETRGRERKTGERPQHQRDAKGERRRREGHRQAKAPAQAREEGVQEGVEVLRESPGARWAGTGPSKQPKPGGPLRRPWPTSRPEQGRIRQEGKRKGGKG